MVCRQLLQSRAGGGVMPSIGFVTVRFSRPRLRVWCVPSGFKVPRRCPVVPWDLVGLVGPSRLRQRLVLLVSVNGLGLRWDSVGLVSVNGWDSSGTGGTRRLGDLA